MQLKLRNDWRLCVGNKTKLKNLERCIAIAEKKDLKNGYTVFTFEASKVKLIKT